MITSRGISSMTLDTKALESFNNSRSKLPQNKEIDISPNIKNIRNLKYGTMIAISPTKEKEGKRIIWKWQCECGYISYASNSQMKFYVKYRCKECLLKEEEKVKELNFNKILSTKNTFPYKLDIKGLKVGTMTAISKTKELYHNGIIWEWKCECGTIKYATNHQMQKYLKYQCETCTNIQMLKLHVDMTGTKIGTMTAIEPTKEKHCKESVWKWKCNCGSLVKATKKQMQRYKKYQCQMCN